jgi:ornithine cyclodeaminase/alanine dehydrogenase-like protein (mu-crystallin family)
VARSTVVVESRATDWREAGDLILARRSGAVDECHIAGDLADLVAGRVAVTSGRPGLFKSVGMAWEDLVVAVAVYERRMRGGPDPQ